MSQRLKLRVKTFAENLGVDLVGVATADRFSEAPKGHRPEDLLRDARSVVVLGLHLVVPNVNWVSMMVGSEVVPQEVLREVGCHLYIRTCYEVINMELERIGYRLAVLLEKQGYRSLHLPATYAHHAPTMRKVPGFYAPFSHRHAAVLAGLGTLGVSHCVLTPTYGPRVRFNSVITTADLEPDEMISGQLCPGESCMLCVRECPPKALSEETYEVRILGRPMLLAKLDKVKCLEEGAGKPSCGGRCIDICPIGKAYIRQLDS